MYAFLFGMVALVCLLLMLGAIMSTRGLNVVAMFTLLSATIASLALSAHISGVL